MGLAKLQTMLPRNPKNASNQPGMAGKVPSPCLPFFQRAPKSQVRENVQPFTPLSGNPEAPMNGKACAAAHDNAVHECNVRFLECAEVIVQLVLHPKEAGQQNMAKYQRSRCNHTRCAKIHAQPNMLSASKVLAVCTNSGASAILTLQHDHSILVDG